MKKFFVTLILMLSIFSITNAYSEEMHKEYYDSGKILKESHFSNDKKKWTRKKSIMKMVKFQVLKTIKMVKLMVNI